MESRAEKIFNIYENKIPEYYTTSIIRKSQVQMTMDIAAFLDNKESKRIMFIEAPVGTGKSLGALIPSMIEKQFEKTLRVVYATATINLQAQLMNSEVPLLKKLFLVKQPILAKGKTHYYCHKEFNAKKDKFSPKEEQVLLNFFRNAESGQRNELEGIFMQDISDSKWAEVAFTGSKKDCNWCEVSRICPTNNHRSNFMSPSSDLIITNHDQLIRSVLNVLSEPRQSPIVPVDPGIIIIDEAHHFLENFLGQLEQSFTISKLRSLKRSVSKKDVKRYSTLLRSMESIINEQTSSIESSLQGRYRVTEDLFVVLRGLSNLIKDSLVDESVKQISRPFTSYDDNSSSELEELSQLLEHILDEKYVKWFNYDEKKFSMISESFPTHFRKCIEYLTRTNKIIVMSGTLTANGDFESLLNQWRLKKNEVLTKRLDSSFDYKNQAIVYVPEKIVRPENKKYLERSVKEIKELISLTTGRSLILTTAKEHMNSISAELTPFLLAKEINLYVQGRSGDEKLTKLFKEDETSVLVGSGSFFSGFSVSGKSLVSVVLTKLPFPVPGDPFLELIGQGYEDEFFEIITFPNMMNKLNQAAGRLIRDITDFGVFTILDPRIFTGSYATKVQADLNNQGYKITRSYAEIATFINKKMKEGAQAQYKPYKRTDIELEAILWEQSLSEVKRVRKVAKETKRTTDSNDLVAEIQLEFAKKICNLYKIKSPTPKNKKSSDLLYKYLIDSLYYNFEDTATVENEFPFRDEEEKKRLLKIKGSERKSVTLPKCIDLGCDGECKEETKVKIREALKENYNAKEVKFNSHSSRPHCSVNVDPLKIIVKSLNSIK